MGKKKTSTYPHSQPPRQVSLFQSYQRFVARWHRLKRQTTAAGALAAAEAEGEGASAAWDGGNTEPPPFNAWMDTFADPTGKVRGPPAGAKRLLQDHKPKKDKKKRGLCFCLVLGGCRVALVAATRAGMAGSAAEAGSEAGVCPTRWTVKAGRQALSSFPLLRSSHSFRRAISRKRSIQLSS